MKKFILIAVVIFATSVSLFSQNSSANYSTGQPSANANVESRAKDATDRLNNLVQLSQDQYNQVLQLNRNFFSRPQSMGSGRGAAKVNYGREQELKSILNGDQWQTYQTARQQGQAF